ncbi:MAG: hypothetical protein HQL31_13490, partial [Planctomycetes bacterium]|nr:hypothetical protein [Planctomycetota bacterium]
HLSVDWGRAADRFEKAVTGCKEIAARQETDNARYIACLYRSSYNFYRAHELKREWHCDMLSIFDEIVQDELDNIRKLLPVLKNDALLGLHLECFARMVNPLNVRNKIRQLENYLKSNKQA